MDNFILCIGVLVIGFLSGYFLRNFVSTEIRKLEKELLDEKQRAVNLLTQLKNKL
jgi:hypothetical protein